MKYLLNTLVILTSVLLFHPQPTNWIVLLKYIILLLTISIIILFIRDKFVLTKVRERKSFNSRQLDRNSTQRNEILCLLKEYKEYEHYPNDIDMELNEIILNLIGVIDQKLEFVNISSAYDRISFYAELASQDVIIGNKYLSGNQIICYKNCYEYIKLKDFPRAFDELYDFLKDRGRRQNTILNIYEIKGIKFLVNEINEQIQWIYYKKIKSSSELQI